jgi:cysteinyl-tRNA synthetase
MSEKRVVFATFATWVTPTVQISKGEAWDADDAVVRSHPDWFTDTPPDVRSSNRESYTAKDADRPTTEAATAAPGEKRSLSRTDQAFDEAASIREELEKRGVAVDKRWGIDRLRKELAKVPAGE